MPRAFIGQNIVLIMHYPLLVASRVITIALRVQTVSVTLMYPLFLLMPSILQFERKPSRRTLSVCKTFYWQLILYILHACFGITLFYFILFYFFFHIWTHHFNIREKKRDIYNYQNIKLCLYYMNRFNYLKYVQEQTSAT